MLPAFVKHIGSFSSKTAGTTIAGAWSSSSTAGNLIVCYLVFDNFTTASKPVVSSISKMAGETANWVFLGAARSTSTSAGAFASGEIWAIQTTIAWTTPTITATLDSSVTMRSIGFSEFTNTQAVLRSTVGTAYSTTTTAASATTTGTAPVVNDLAVGLLFQSNTPTVPTGDTDATSGSWSAAQGVGSTGSSGATNNMGAFQYKVLTGTSHQTLNDAGTVTAGNGAIVAILQAMPDPAITQASYRFYADGTETGATALAAQDTAYVADLSAADVNLQIRMRLQTTTTAAVQSTDDFTLQWEKNTSGTWTTVDTQSTGVTAYASANITEGAATTNRLGAGTGSFVAGEASVDGTVNDLGWAGNAYTEVLYSVTLKRADLGGGDSIRFRVVRNGSTATLTYSQYPTVTVLPPKISTLTEDFSTLTAWTTVSGTPTLVGGQLRLLAVNSQETVTSKTKFDATESQISAQIAIPQMPPSSFRQVYIRLGTVTTNLALYLNMSQALGQARAHIATNDPTNGFLLSSSNYVPTAPGTLWYRLRFSGTTAYLETSVDATAWTTRVTHTPVAQVLAALSSVPVTLYSAQGTVLADDPQYFYLDNINLGAALSRPKVYLAGAFTQKPAKVWTGSAWTEKPVKVWTGSTWKTLT